MLSTIVVFNNDNVISIYKNKLVSSDRGNNLKIN